MSILSEKIIELKNQGMSYIEISKAIPCSLATISYYLNPNGKRNVLKRQKRHRTECHPYFYRVKTFLKQRELTKTPTNNSGRGYKSLLNSKIIKFYKRIKTTMNKPFTVEDVINKFGENPVCYLTGEPIDITKPSTYQFDHVIPVSRGGDSSIDNLAICTKQANLCKRDMTPDELIFLCRKILKHQGYTISDSVGS